MTPSYPLVNIYSKQTTRNVASFKFLVLFNSQEDPSNLRSSESSCFLEDNEASFVPCESRSTREVAQSAYESKMALEALSLNGDLLRYVLR